MTKFKALLRFLFFVNPRTFLIGLETVIFDNYDCYGTEILIKKLPKQRKQKAIGYLNKLYKK